MRGGSGANLAQDLQADGQSAPVDVEVGKHDPSRRDIPFRPRRRVPRNLYRSWRPGGHSSGSCLFRSLWRSGAGRDRRRRRRLARLARPLGGGTGGGGGGVGKASDRADGAAATDTNARGEGLWRAEEANKGGRGRGAQDGEVAAATGRARKQRAHRGLREGDRGFRIRR